MSSGKPEHLSQGRLYHSPRDLPHGKTLLLSKSLLDVGGSSFYTKPEESVKINKPDATIDTKISEN